MNEYDQMYRLYVIYDRTLALLVLPVSTSILATGE